MSGAAELRLMMRSAGYALGALIGSLCIYILSVCVYYTEPWYDRAIIDQLRRAAPMPLWGDVSDEAAKIFPDGMMRTAAATLLRDNGFSCAEGGTESGSGAQRLKCHREPHILFCAGHYDVALNFEAGERVRDRTASFYVACL